MKIGDIVEYTDHRGAKHDAKITRVVKQPTNIEGTQHTEIINVEYNAGGRVRIAELITNHPNTSGQCYGKVLKGEEDFEDTEEKEPEDNTTPDERATDDEEPKKQESSEDPDGDAGPEASSEADDESESEPSEKS